MKYKLLLCVMIVALLAGCGRNKTEETTQPAENPETIAAQEISTSPETTEAVDAPETTEATVPGVEANVFDGNENTVTEPEKETTASTEPKETKPSGGSTTPTKPAGSGGLEEPDDIDPPETSKPAEEAEKETEPSQPTEPENQETTPPASSTQSDYEIFQAMTPSEQQAYMESFESIDAFFDWYDQAKSEHEAANPSIDVGNGNIDLDEIIGGNS